ncbi:flagellin N-terminal helical domain-containing protein [Paracoccus onubensis]|uniref:Flagellin n=1 Tax=Paracoccus onubensis TaxID=1675788 RepID=A0A418SZV7_9RHOB|nr:flagellin [Paracoccus onubensis]RJE86477.1 flagellin [Paracoccus onubensis]
MTSILTNNGAIVALQTLKNTNKMLGITQREISTGKRINTAADGSAIWAVAKTMETDRDAFKTIQQGLNVASKVVSTAVENANGIVDDLKIIKDRLTASSNSDQDVAKNWDEISELIDGIKAKIDSSQINGVNLLNTGGTGGDPATQYTVLASLDRSYGATTTGHTAIVVQSQDFTTAVYDKLAAWTKPTTSKAAEALISGAVDHAVDATTGKVTSTVTADTDTSVEALIEFSINAAAKLGAKQHRIEAQEKSVGQIKDNLTSGIGALVDSNLEEASARLQALQTQQQLGIQSLSIANQAPGAVLALFR